MRKRILSSTNREPAQDEVPWLDLDAMAEVEVSSEAPGHPIEAALLPGHDADWQAAEGGTQTIRVIFDAPQKVGRIRLRFREENIARTHEFLLGWSPDGTAPYEEIVRQQFNFSPPSTVEEVEDYQVELLAVKSLELTIQPDVGRGSAVATLTRLQIA